MKVSYRGYATLHVNFRISGGYGKEFLRVYLRFAYDTIHFSKLKFEENLCQMKLKQNNRWIKLAIIFHGMTVKIFLNISLIWEEQLLTRIVIGSKHTQSK